MASHKERYEAAKKKTDKSEADWKLIGDYEASAMKARDKGKDNIFSGIKKTLLSYFFNKRQKEKKKNKKQKKPSYEGKKPYGLGTVDYYASGGK